MNTISAIIPPPAHIGTKDNVLVTVNALSRATRIRTGEYAGQAA